MILSPYLMFLDESGDHNLNNLDYNDSIFCLAGAIFSANEYLQKLHQVNELKLKFFGHEGVIFHSRDIRRMKEEFAILKDPLLKSNFYEQLNSVMKKGYQIVCCSISKPEYVHKHGKQNKISPYHLSLGILLKRLGIFLQNKQIQNLRIIAESRGKTEDQDLQKQFHSILSM